MTPLPATIATYREMAQKHGTGAVGRCILALCDALQDCEAAIKAAENAQAVDRDFQLMCESQHSEITRLGLELRSAYAEIDRLREDIDFVAIHEAQEGNHVRDDQRQRIVALESLIRQIEQVLDIQGLLDGKGGAILIRTDDRGAGLRDQIATLKAQIAESEIAKYKLAADLSEWDIRHIDTERRLAGRVQRARAWARAWKYAATENRRRAHGLAEQESH